MESKAGDALRRFFDSGWAFDWIYDRLFVKPFLWLTRTNKNDAVDLVYTLAKSLTRGLHHIGALTQTGRLRWYAANMAIGLIVVLLIAAGWL